MGNRRVARHTKSTLSSQRWGWKQYGRFHTEKNPHRHSKCTSHKVQPLYNHWNISNTLLFCSRPSSPVAPTELVNGNAVLAAALQKRNNRKRKIPSIESEDSQDAPATAQQPPAGPRQSGSMVSHHDDIVTRMKNIELIELGRHRIKPWYFAPYPQVSRIWGA